MREKAENAGNSSGLVQDIGVLCGCHLVSVIVHPVVGVHISNVDIAVPEKSQACQDKPTAGFCFKYFRNQFCNI